MVVSTAPFSELLSPYDGDAQMAMQNYEKFIPSPAANDVFRTNLLRQPAGEALQHVITPMMSPTIIDEFKVIEIEKQNAKRSAGAYPVLHLAFAFPSVSQASQWIGRGQILGHREALPEFVDFFTELVDMRPGLLLHHLPISHHLRHLRRQVRANRGQAVQPRDAFQSCDKAAKPLLMIIRMSGHSSGRVRKQAQNFPDVLFFFLENRATFAGKIPDRAGERLQAVAKGAGRRIARQRLADSGQARSQLPDQFISYGRSVSADCVDGAGIAIQGYFQALLHVLHAIGVDGLFK